MTQSVSIEQAIFTLENGQLHERGVSEGLAAFPAWRTDAERLLRGFGTPPPDVSCPAAVFANPLGPAHVAVVQVADHPGGGLQFRLLVLPRTFYRDWVRDPFAVDDRFPPDWSASGPLPALTWPVEPPPRRTVAQLQQVLQNGGSPTLLGATQALVDGGRVVFERAAPATRLTRDIWQLLPERVQGELWPASFAFSNDLRFDLLTVPKADAVWLDRYVTEERAVDYPEGHYEFSLQYAVEHGDQAEVDRLLARRSGKQVLRTAIIILLGGTLAYLGINYLLSFL